VADLAAGSRLAAGGRAGGAAAEVVDVLSQAEVCCTARRRTRPVRAAAPCSGGDADDGTTTSCDSDDTSDDPQRSSRWHNGVPPFGTWVPVERYPEIIGDYDWESFGIAISVEARRCQRGIGDQCVLRAVALVYQDERSTSSSRFSALRRGPRRKHGSALRLVERFAVPATASDQVPPCCGSWRGSTTSCR
jgi:hypothetical protein